MRVSDWRSAEAYEYLSDLGASEFAWEFLRRNPDYIQEFRDIDRRSGASEIEVASRYWGLSFRGRPSSVSPRNFHSLDPKSIVLRADRRLGTR